MLTRRGSHRPLVPRGCEHLLWLTCPCSGRAEEGPKLSWQSKESTGLFSLMPQTGFPDIYLQWFCPGQTPSVSSSAVPASQGAPSLPPSSFFISVCAVCHWGNLICLGLCSALVFKSKRSAHTIKNVLHDTLGDMEIYSQIKVAASTAKQLN